MTDKAVLGATRAVLAAAWTAIAVVVLLGDAPSHPFVFGAIVRQTFMLVMPQGWAFFTRNPREAIAHTYRVSPVGLISIDDHNASLSNFVGFRKRARVASAEVGALIDGLPAKRWRPCAAGVAACMRDRTPTHIAVVNHASIRSVCGPIVVDKRPPVPWAWNRYADRVHMPSTYVLLDVQCAPERPATTFH